MNRAALPFLLCLALTSACGPKRIGKEVLWPPPPDIARIKFVTSVRSSANLNLSTMAQVLRTTLGAGVEASIERPTGLALSRNGRRLYVSDSTLARVMVVDFDAKSVSVLADNTDVGMPYGLATDAEDNVYVVDQVGRRVVVLSPTGTVLRAFGAKDLMTRPTGIAIDAQRKLVYVSDPTQHGAEDHHVFVFDTQGQWVRTMGEGHGSADGQFHFPLFMAVNAQGHLFVADSMNFRVQEFDPEGNFVAKFGKQGDGPGTFNRMKGMAFDSFGNLYIVEADAAAVQIFSPSFQPLMFFGGRQPLVEYMDLPSGLAIDPATNLIYVANEVHGRVNVYQLINTTADDDPSGR